MNFCGASFQLAIDTTLFVINSLLILGVELEARATVILNTHTIPPTMPAIVF